MNDRFKFRGKRLDNNEWYYGSYLYLHNADKFDWNNKRHTTNEDVHYIIDENDVNYAVNPETVGQCTGLKDKNGTLIYEGDIVKFNYDTDEIIAVVSWDNGKDATVGYYLNTTDYFKDKYVTDYDFYKNDYEVIGNIYENADLLEDTECT